MQEHRSQGPDASFGMPRVRPVTPDFITRRSITKANPVHERARLLNDVSSSCQKPESIANHLGRL